MGDKGVTISTTTLIVLLILFSGLIYWSVTQHNKLKDFAHEVQVYQDSVVPGALAYADSQKAVAATARAEADSAKARADKKTAEVVQLKGTVSVLRKRNQSLVDSALSDTLIPPAAREAILGLQEENDSLQHIITLQDQRDEERVIAISRLEASNLALQQRGDSLETIIINYPKPPKPPKLLGITLPHISAPVAAISGAIIGGLIVAEVKN